MKRKLFVLAAIVRVHFQELRRHFRGYGNNLRLDVFLHNSLVWFISQYFRDVWAANTDGPCECGP